MLVQMLAGVQCILFAWIYVVLLLPKPTKQEEMGTCVKGKQFYSAFVAACSACPSNWEDCFWLAKYDQQRCVESCRKKPTTPLSLNSATIALALEPLEQNDGDDPGAEPNNREERAPVPNNVEGRAINMRIDDEERGHVRNDDEERAHVQNDHEERGPVRNDDEELGPIRYDGVHRRTCQMFPTHLNNIRDMFTHNSCLVNRTTNFLCVSQRNCHAVEFN